MRKKLKQILALTIGMSLILMACGKATSTTDTSAKDQSLANTTAGSTSSETGEIKLVFWHAMSGKVGEAWSTIESDFNQEFKGKISVESQYQGSYDDSLTKLKTSQLGNFEADVVQVYDIGTRLMIDSGWITPVSELAANDPSWNKDAFVPAIYNYYNVDNQLYSLPFNTSTPVMFYNKTAFKEAGLDAENPPKTFAQLIEVSNKLNKADGSQNAIAMAHYGWFFEQLLCKQMLPYVDNENGRQSFAQKTVFKENGGALKALQAWNSLYESGAATDLGRLTKETKAGFISGKIAITFDSSSSLNDLLSNVGDSFEVGTGYYPDLDTNTKGGVSIGGGSLWVLKNDDLTKQDAIWQFLKYLSRPDVQAKWSILTGYFPTVTEAYKDTEFVKYLKDVPQLQVPIDQLNASPVESRGALFTVFPQARQIVEDNIEKMVSKNQTPEQAVDNMTKAINEAIEDYNLINN